MIAVDPTATIATALSNDTVVPPVVVPSTGKNKGMGMRMKNRRTRTRR